MHFKMRLKPSFNLIDLTPLVDVIFLLLVFFLITADVLPLKSLSIENPQIDRETLPLTTQILVVMDAEQVIYVGNKHDIVDLGSVKEHLLREIQALHHRHPGANPTIVLSVDRRVDYGAFLKLFALTQECGPNIRLAYKT